MKRTNMISIDKEEARRASALDPRTKIKHFRHEARVDQVHNANLLKCFEGLPFLAGGKRKLAKTEKRIGRSLDR